MAETALAARATLAAEALAAALRPGPTRPDARAGAASLRATARVGPGAEARALVRALDAAAEGGLGARAARAIVPTAAWVAGAGPVGTRAAGAAEARAVAAMASLAAEARAVAAEATLAIGAPARATAAAVVPVRAATVAARQLAPAPRLRAGAGPDTAAALAGRLAEAPPVRARARPKAMPRRPGILPNARAIGPRTWPEATALRPRARAEASLLGARTRAEARAIRARGTDAGALAPLAPFTPGIRPRALVPPAAGGRAALGPRAARPLALAARAAEGRALAPRRPARVGPPAGRAGLALLLLRLLVQMAAGRADAAHRAALVLPPVGGGPGGLGGELEGGHGGRPRTGRWQGGADERSGGAPGPRCLAAKAGEGFPPGASRGPGCRAPGELRTGAAQRDWTMARGRSGWAMRACKHLERVLHRAMGRGSMPSGPVQVEPPRVLKRLPGGGQTDLAGAFNARRPRPPAVAAGSSRSPQAVRMPSSPGGTWTHRQGGCPRPPRGGACRDAGLRERQAGGRPRGPPDGR